MMNVAHILASAVAGAGMVAEPLATGQAHALACLMAAGGLTMWGFMQALAEPEGLGT